MFCCCFPLHISVSTSAIQLCAVLQFAVLVLAAACGEQASLGLLCAGLLFSVASSKNYNTIGLFVVLAGLDVVRMVEEFWQTGSLLICLRMSLHFGSMIYARMTYTALKCAHSTQVHDPKPLQEPLLC